MSACQQRKARSARHWSGLETAILGRLADGQPWRCHQLLRALGLSGQARRLQLELERLAARGALERVRPGLYVVAGAPHPGTSFPAFAKAAGRAADRAMALMTGPRSFSELRLTLGLSPRRTEQVLRQLIWSGQVERPAEDGRTGHWIYPRQPDETAEVVEQRPINIWRLNAPRASTIRGASPGRPRLAPRREALLHA